MLTCFGLSWVWLSPWPRRPYSPRPQVYSSPVQVTAALCELPHAISRILFVFKASTKRGLSQFLRKKGVKCNHKNYNKNKRKKKKKKKKSNTPLAETKSMLLLIEHMPVM